jgi:hypothetical protein
MDQFHDQIYGTAIEALVFCWGFFRFCPDSTVDSSITTAAYPAARRDMKPDAVPQTHRPWPLLFGQGFFAGHSFDALVGSIDQRAILTCRDASSGLSFGQCNSPDSQSSVAMNWSGWTVKYSAVATGTKIKSQSRMG